ncbi:MAG: AGE family epimerase/isomerase [Eubacteriales bacterium]|nr:AGE family epimerase/isomerase [Eubacteriales bacterium]
MNSGDKIKHLHDKVQHDLLSGILPFWLKYAPDDNNGGFYGRINRDGSGISEAPKALVLNARILWTFSASYRVFDCLSYIKAADRAFNYIVEYFLTKEPENNGGYWLLNADGSVREAVGNMHTYSQAFLLYALSEYAMAADNAHAYRYAGLMFYFIDKFCRLGNLYTETPYQNKPNGLKLSMNTHLHVLEAITNYYRICGDKQTETSLINIIILFLETVYNKNTRHQNMFFNAEGISQSNTVSYGHDIEFSWLLTEAAAVLRANSADISRFPSLYEDCAICAADVAESVLTEGLDENCGALADEAINGKAIHNRKIWWVQAEAVVGFLNAWQSCGEERYLDAAYGIFDYIDHNIIDHEYGEWYHSGLDFTPEAKNGFKADEWKCPYHNSRMALEVIGRLKHINSQANHTD